MLMNASTMNQMQKATRAASRRKTSNRSINVKINKTIGVNLSSIIDNLKSPSPRGQKS
jgi:hypothetical protein